MLETAREKQAVRWADWTFSTTETGWLNIADDAGLMYSIAPHIAQAIGQMIVQHFGAAPQGEPVAWMIEINETSEWRPWSPHMTRVEATELAGALFPSDKCRIVPLYAGAAPAERVGRNDEAVIDRMHAFIDAADADPADPNTACVNRAELLCELEVALAAAPREQPEPEPCAVGEAREADNLGAFYCNKCGHVGPTSHHAGCRYLAVAIPTTTNAAPTGEAARLADELGDAAKFLRDCRGTEPAEFFEEHARTVDAAARLLRGERAQSGEEA